MLELVDIIKEYAVAGEKVPALKGISVKFRSSEFVSILGPSGCGKTTLLNIVGGLDQYTSGDLIINGVSTKKYGDRDWDTYRNHSIGFIFQSYHLIPHQTILQNVELALMIAGVDKKERRQRAIEALARVGLKDKIHNRPNQLSGGQAQRVAIARALINDPEIVLADEPTGALDSVTSVQIMELLKDISRDRLVVMVTHNPELAEKYSTRIVRLKDGEIVGDTRPFDGRETVGANKKTAGEYGGAQEDVLNGSLEDIARLQSEAYGEAGAANGSGALFADLNSDIDENGKTKKTNKGRRKKTAMSVGMAMGLSCKNLMSKSKRTAMVSVAGSIGIIGVSMVLAISAGVHGYINTMQNDMLSGNPVSITQSTYDFTTLMALNRHSVAKEYVNELKNGGEVGVTSLLKTLGTFSTGFEKSNQFTEDYIAYLGDMPKDCYRVMQFKYAFNIVNNLYTDFTVSDNLASHFDAEEYNEKGYAEKNTRETSVAAIRAMYSSVLTHVEDYKQWGSMVSTVETFTEVPDNFDYVMSQYDVLAIDRDGEVVTSDFTQEEIKTLFEDDKQTLILVVDDSTTQELTLAQYGYFTEDEFLDYALKGVGTADESTTLKERFKYSELIGKNSKKFTYYPNDCVYNEIATKVMSDDEVRADNPTFANDIIAHRHSGDKAFKEYIYSDEFGARIDVMIAMMGQLIPDGSRDMFKKFMLNSMYTKYRIPDSDEKSFAASAYSDAYTYDNGVDEPITFEAFEDKDGYDKRVELGVKLILEKKESVSYGCLDAGFYYTNALTEYILNTEAESKIVKYLGADKSLANVPMYVDYFYVDPEKDGKETTEDGKKYYLFDTEECSIETNINLMSSIIDSVIGGVGSSSSTQLTADVFGGTRKPIAIYIYPVDFTTKDTVTAYLDAWNAACEGEGTVTLSDGTEISGLTEGNKITYNDTVGLMINMINTMIEMITIALVAFTALSLVVSTVMIGIITYVSVVERVKEIGILRAVGARKKDIKRLFNAETFIIGLIAGIFGIAITLLLSLVINIIVNSLAGIWGIAALPWWQGLIMIALSVVLTLISGLIPASAAAKKDPVVALRTE